ncbi:hypothetical protein RHMOL_Rhmol04G0282700 [Rhododendron molle]|uniref:Uncharacterized protein n=1 Tax=Rhododendron molle TaxID=49168 RepID=A0ACC0P540_RHOML|nr:hypothetical protein RHMOL_Rhmol04G0282700 [Rhododendron molle]
MDGNGKECSNVKNCSEGKPRVSVGDSEKVELNGEIHDDNDTQSLLPPGPPRRGGLSKKSGNPRRKVQWNDRNGNKLAEVVIFQPSLLGLLLDLQKKGYTLKAGDVSDSDDEDSDSCMCAVM